LTCGDLDLLPFIVKIGLTVTPAPTNVHTNFGFTTRFRSRVRSPYQHTDRPV